MRSNPFVFGGSVINTEAAADAALTVVALTLRRADLTDAQLKVRRSRQRPTPVRGCPFLFCLTEADKLIFPTIGRC
jgi:hypothetical protein